ncbi:MAG: sigma-70 family RNA polymerase sigma factor [Bacteroidota bacterium]
MSIQNLKDNELVEQYINGNENCLPILLNRHQRKIFSSIMMVVQDRQLTEDIFQDTFIKVIQTLKRGQYNEEGKFAPWVIRIARNLVIDHYRRLRKMPRAPVFVNEDGEESNVFSGIASDNTADADALKPILKKNVRNLINELPEDQREVVLMRIYYDMSFKEIAEFRNISINTALGRMRYALFNLKKMIEEKNLAFSLR